MQSALFVPNIMEAPWSSEEHNLFLQGYLVYGKSWIEIAEVVRTRNAYQVCAYANWLENHNCLPRLPPIPQAAAPLRVGLPTMQQTPTNAAAQINNAAAASKIIKTQSDTIRKGVWSKDEHERFLKGLEQWGKGSWSKIAEVVKTRNSTQVLSHARHYFKKLDGTASGTKRKASDSQQPEKPKKKLAATTKSPKKKTAKTPTKAVGVSQLKAKPVPSAAVKTSGGARKKKKVVETDINGNHTLDIQPPAIKLEAVVKKAASTPVEKAIGDKTELKPEATKASDPCVQFSGDEGVVVKSPLMGILSPLMGILKDKRKMAIAAVVSIALTAGTVVVYLGSGNGGDATDDSESEL
jgi:SHAQKYF class myb-like DNA-binding protein